MKSVSIDARGRAARATTARRSARCRRRIRASIIGSYPSFNGQSFTNQIVVRARDEEHWPPRAAAVEAMLVELIAKRDAPAAGLTA